MGNSQANKATVRSFFDAMGARNPDRWDNLCTPDFISHDPVLPSPHLNLEAEKAAMKQMISAFPDLRVVVDDVIAEGELVAVRWSFNGTHQGIYWNIKPTGRKVSVSAITIHRLNEDGFIAERWVSLDAIGLLEQLGVLP